MSEHREIVAERLTELLKLKDFSQADLARKSGVSKTTISKAINDGVLSVKIAKLLSKTLGVSLDYLYGNSDIESIPQYVFDVLMKHVSSFNRKSLWGGDSLIATISISQQFVAYLESICEAEKSNASDKVRKDWRQDAKEKFLQVIENDTKQKVEYALVKHEYLTDKVLEQLASAKEEIAERR